MKSYKLLHLSDLHAGAEGQDFLWPNVKEQFHKDLGTLVGYAGPWDAVLFSGDFAQFGADAEFDVTISRLSELWEKFRALGFDPMLICTPGNHDILRPSSKEPAVRIMKDWPDHTDILEKIFSDPDDIYCRTVNAAMAGYERFLAGLRHTSIPLIEGERGLVPGDQRIELLSDDTSVGLVTFNSTWLQVTGDDYKGKLVVDPRQSLRLAPDLGGWCSRNQFNVIVSHHPADWLHSRYLGIWNSEISPPGRFDVHLFGHMHEPFTSTTSHNGGETRHAMQAPSLFGMEYLADGTTPRIHGYSLIEFETSGTRRSMRVWPRELRRGVGGDAWFAANQKFKLEEDRFFRLRLPDGEAKLQPVRAASPALEAASVEELEKDVLRPLRYHLPLRKAHLRVRRLEQTRCTEALAAERAVWIVSEWGLGSDEFLSASLMRVSAARKVYRLDASDYSNKDEFTKELGRKLGTSFAAICDALGNEPSVLVVDDIPVDNTAPGGLDPYADIETLVSVLKDSCPTLWIVMRTRLRPARGVIACIELWPLDEADVAVYVGDHERGGSRLVTVEATSVLFRRTGGYPSRLDTALKELEVVSFEEFASGEDALLIDGQEIDDAPPILKRTIQRLATAADKPTKRMFDLLKVLTVFPQGAELGRIKRFNGVHPFWGADAVGLKDRGLITVAETPTMEGMLTEPQKILVVPRPIRDYLLSQIAQDTLDNLHSRAADLLFGAEWMAGSKDWPAQSDYSSSRCGTTDIANASVLLIRLFRLYKDAPESREATSIVTLGTAFAGALCSGSHYMSAANFCRDFMALMTGNEAPDKRATLLSHYGLSVRMLGETAKAADILDQIKDYDFPKDRRQMVKIELSLCYANVNRGLSLELANEALKLNRNNSYGFQARGIIADLELKGGARTTALGDIERRARNKGFVMVADNIAIQLATAASDEDAKVLLANVLQGKKQGPQFYNRTRAVLEMAGRKVAAYAEISDTEVSQLIDSYQFLLNERISGMFDKCHKALWYAFLEARNWDSLLMLFRYTSMIWRLRGDVDGEKTLFAELAENLSAVPTNDIENSRAFQYYVARSLHHNGAAPTLQARRRPKSLS